MPKLSEARPDVRSESYPQLPDWGEAVVPHPDGRPWRKACAVCAFRRSDPQQMGAELQKRVLSVNRAKTLFYCVHRTDGDYSRVCACFAACGSPALASQPD